MKGQRQALVHLVPVGRKPGIERVEHRRVGLGGVVRRVRVRERDDEEQRAARVATIQEFGRLALDPAGRMDVRPVRKRLAPAPRRARRIAPALSRRTWRDHVVEPPVGVPVRQQANGGSRRARSSRSRLSGAEPLRVEVLAQAQRLEPVLRVDGREVRLADQGRLVAASPELVRDRPEALPQRPLVLLGRDTVRLDAGHERDPRRARRPSTRCTRSRRSRRCGRSGRGWACGSDRRWRSRAGRTAAGRSGTGRCRAGWVMLSSIGPYSGTQTKWCCAKLVGGQQLERSPARAVDQLEGMLARSTTRTGAACPGRRRRTAWRRVPRLRAGPMSVARLAGRSPRGR